MHGLRAADDNMGLLADALDIALGDLLAADMLKRLSAS
jgi:hypothetical protein